MIKIEIIEIIFYSALYLFLKMIMIIIILMLVSLTFAITSRVLKIPFKNQEYKQYIDKGFLLLFHIIFVYFICVKGIEILRNSATLFADYEIGFILKILYFFTIQISISLCLLASVKLFELFYYPFMLVSKCTLEEDIFLKFSLMVLSLYNVIPILSVVIAIFYRITN